MFSHAKQSRSPFRLQYKYRHVTCNVNVRHNCLSDVVDYFTLPLLLASIKNGLLCWMIVDDNK